VKSADQPSRARQLLTAYDIPGIENYAVGPVLRKPNDPDQLVAEVRRALARD
jgi:hypothetical protein